jgi:predicted RNase H-like nuclease
MLVIGIDCAVSDKNIGLAKGKVTTADQTDNQAQTFVVEVTDAVRGGDEPVLDTLTRWIPDDEKVLLCLDAPLGWPKFLGDELINHSAGDFIATGMNDLFTRYTDKFLRDKIGKRPMEVGANLIARTAHAALKLLEQLRDVTGEEIPLAWQPQLGSRIEAIEVYPAGTLVARNWKAGGYKKKGNVGFRTALLDQISREMNISLIRSMATDSHHVMDAVLCTLTGMDFLNNRCYEPDKPDVARKEGWIWFLRSEL